MGKNTSKNIRIILGVLAMLVGLICLLGKDSNIKLSIECMFVGLMLVVSTLLDKLK